MKRHGNRMAGRLRAGLAALLCAALALPLFAGCTAAPKLEAPPAAATPGSEAPGTAAVEPEGGALLAGTVIDVSDGSLLLAGEGDYDGLYRLSLDSVPVEPGGAEALCVGKRAEVTFGGTVAECFPGIPGGVTRVRAVDGDLSPFVLYRQVLFDLMETDEGLNGGARYLGMDLSGAANLTGGEKLALQYLLEQQYGLSVLPGTFDELCEPGLHRPGCALLGGRRAAAGRARRGRDGYVPVRCGEVAQWARGHLLDGLHGRARRGRLDV